MSTTLVERSARVEPIAYSVPQVMQATSLGRTTVFTLITSGELPSIVVGRRRLVLATALRAFLEHGAP
jgi:excisionase family DNA binding protein